MTSEDKKTEHKESQGEKELVGLPGVAGPATPRTAEELPVADTESTNTPAGFTLDLTYKVEPAPADRTDHMILIRATVLRRCRRRLKEMASARTKIEDLLLSGAALSAGAWLAAVSSNVDMGGWRSFVFFHIAPILAVALTVALLSCGTRAQEIMWTLPPI